MSNTFTSPIELSVAPSVADDEKEQFQALLAEDIPEEETRNDLEAAIHLFGPFYINKTAAARLKESFEGVVLPSLLTKIFGRYMMISGWVSTATPAAYILTNLFQVAPGVALIAAATRFIYVLVAELRTGSSWRDALKKAGITSVQTGIKFFLVYLGWTLAMALAMKLTILTGGLLPLGILFVGILTCAAFALASFLVDKLPSLLLSPKSSWNEFTSKIKALKTCIIPGIMEGSIWSLMDNHIASISAHIVGTAGKLLDLVGISIAVPFAFFVGAIIHNSISRKMKLRKQTKKIDRIQVQKIQNKVIEIHKDILNETTREHAFSFLKKLNLVKDPQLKATIIKYIQCRILLNAADNLAHNHISLTRSQESWFEPSLRISAASLIANGHVLKLFSELVSSTPQTVSQTYAARGTKVKTKTYRTRSQEQFKNEVAQLTVDSFRQIKRFGLFSRAHNPGKFFHPDLTVTSLVKL